MDLTTRDVDTVFAELICADPQWLREEFDALIAASFSQPPAAPPPAPPRVPPHRRHPGSPRPGRQRRRPPARHLRGHRAGTPPPALASGLTGCTSLAHVSDIQKGDEQDPAAGGLNQPWLGSRGEPSHGIFATSGRSPPASR